MSTRSNIAIEDPKTKKVKVIYVHSVTATLTEWVNAWLIIITNPHLQDYYLTWRRQLFR